MKNKLQSQKEEHSKAQQPIWIIMQKMSQLVFGKLGKEKVLRSFITLPNMGPRKNMYSKRASSNGVHLSYFRSSTTAE